MNEVERLANILQDTSYLDVSNEEFWWDAAEQLIANGVIVPPCKVGERVYCIRFDKARKPFVKPLEVRSITTFGTGKFTVFTTKEDYWGVTAFATNEEAEEALKERSKGW